HAPAGAAPMAAESLLVSDRMSSIAGLDALIRRYVPRPGALRARLSRTGRRITVGEYLLFCLLLGSTATAIRSLVFELPLVLAVLFGIVTALGPPHMVVGWMIKRRLKKFVAQFPEAIDLILRGLKAGLPVTESIRVVANEFPAPMGEEFRRIADAVALGEPLDKALWAAAARLDTPEFRFFAICLSVQRETGGNLTETLENLADVLRRRQQMALKINAMSSEARASAMILGSLPFVMFAIMMAVSGDYVMDLFTDPRGILMVVAGLTSLGLGVIVMARMIRFDI
ncbi:MAG: type II secretion system F family protein, partial [Alphaproteobacteria bacterium]|nr:type II secretion system F family protein [Alphaproteobacteria bacterium]